MADYHPKQARAIQTKADILAAAQECFARHGYDATVVSEICDQAGISKGAFYHHFPSKQAVYLELLREWLSDFDRGMDAVQENADSVPETLRAMSTAFPSIFQVAQGQLPIILDFWVKSFQDPEVRDATVAPFDHYHEMVTALIRKGIEEGSLEQTDARKTALILISVGVGSLLQGLLTEDGDEWGQVGQKGIDLILKSIERKSHA
jgi:AcrR family transcriptional regulator